jgi:c-di-GMP-binding flagellar brake protein YcgR
VDRPANIEERRRYPRVGCNLPLKYRNLKKLSEQPSGALSKDIGEGGVRFKTNGFISLACRLVMEINLPTITKPIKAISKVAWIKKIPAGDEYELGNQFLEMTKEDKSHIRDFVDKSIAPETTSE